MKRILLIISTVFISSFTFGQALISWDFSGNVGNEVTVAGTPQDPAVTGGAISRGGGIAAANNGNRFNANSWTQPDEAGALANDDYFEFTITLSEIACLTSIDFNYQRSGTGPQNFSLRSSVDGFAANITTFTGLGSSTSETAALPAASFAAVTGTITFRLYGYGNTNGGGSGGFEGGGDDLVINGALKPQPVVLTSFIADKISNKSIKLTWRTASEQNNDYFSVEHSNNGVSFDEIAQVKGNGTTDLAKAYAFMHDDAAQGDNYYRLRQVDYDGQFEYSKVEVVNIKESNAVTVRPTLATDRLTIDTKEVLRNNATVHVFDINGKMMSNTLMTADSDQLVLNIASLTSGHYFVRFNDGQTSETIRFVKL